MTQLLELAHLVDQDRMSNVQIWCRRIKARFNEQWPAKFEFCLESVLGQYLVGAARQLCKLLLDTRHYPYWPISVNP